MVSKQENPFYNLLFNILLPVLILNKGDLIFSSNSSLYSLLLALTFPLIYGSKDYFLSKKINTMSLIGVIGVALTGGLALFQLKGIYFAIKESAIPLAIALWALGSIYWKKPLASLLFFKSSLFKKDLLLQKLKENQKEKDFEQLMIHSTIGLAGSFLLSAVLNFVIAVFVFKGIDSNLEEEHRRQILNEQIADMTWMGYIFIALPLTLIMGFLLWHITKKLKQMTGLGIHHFLLQNKT